MGMAAILFNDAEPFEQIDGTPSTEGPVWNLMKIGRAVSEKKTFTDYQILYIYNPGARASKPGGQNFDRI